MHECVCDVAVKGIDPCLAIVQGLVRGAGKIQHPGASGLRVPRTRNKNPPRQCAASLVQPGRWMQAGCVAWPQTTHKKDGVQTGRGLPCLNNCFGVFNREKKCSKIQEYAFFYLFSLILASNPALSPLSVTKLKTFTVSFSFEVGVGGVRHPSMLGGGCRPPQGFPYRLAP